MESSLQFLLRNKILSKVLIISFNLIMCSCCMWSLGNYDYKYDYDYWLLEYEFLLTYFFNLQECLIDCAAEKRAVRNLIFIWYFIVWLPVSTFLHPSLFILNYVANYHSSLFRGKRFKYDYLTSFGLTLGKCTPYEIINLHSRYYTLWLNQGVNKATMHNSYLH